jgi:hypothetical protein
MSNPHANVSTKTSTKLSRPGPLAPLLDRLGNRNPQLLRELRGRLKPGFVLATLGTSIAGQLLYGLSRLGALPQSIKDPFSADKIARNIYCLGPIPEQYSAPTCVQDALGQVTVNWPLWWGDGLPMFHWTMLSIAIVIGSYLLIADWSQEADRGTLDPLRLSPQAAPSILWGKLLGVPLLVYLFLLSGLPLYLMAMVGAGRSPATIVGGLAIDLAQISFWFTTSLLLAVCFRKGGGSKAILGAMGVSMGLFWAFHITGSNPHGWMADLMRLISPSLGLAGGLPHGPMDAYSLSYSQQYLRGNEGLVWFGWPIATSMLRLSLFTVGVLGSWSYACWLALNRRFDRPNATLWSKGQIYGITAVVTTLALGSVSGWVDNNWGSFQADTFLSGQQMPIFWLLLPFSLTLIQSRQSLLDWMRHPAAPTTSRRTTHRQDLIWGESSPPWVAFGIQIAIVALIVIPYNLLRSYALDNGAINQTAAWTFLLLTNLGLLLMGLAQLIQLRVPQRAGVWTAVTLAVGLFGLPIGMAFFGQNNVDNPLGLLTFYPLAAIDSNAPGALLAMVGVEWLGLALIYHHFNRNLRRLSSSDMARALTPNGSATPTRST